MNGQVPETRFNDYSIKIELSDIKIIDYKMWENCHQNQFINDPNLPIEQSLIFNVPEEDELLLEKKVKVTGYFI